MTSKVFALTALFCSILSLASLGKDYTYQEIPKDPLNTRIYQLENGLTVFLSQNKTKPNIHAYIAVKAGSSYDPADNTGLAHYLEHMLFKGTSQYGTSEWTKEKIYLDKIASLYEKHKAEQDPLKKKSIYREIDSISQIASKYAIPNEFDKMMSSIGANGVNAFTSFDQTVYTEEIPANQLEKWAKIESERLNNLVLRLFHTEIEAVYEEFNIGQDDDGNLAFDAMMNGLFPNHPYGTQTTIGQGAHLKNPSMLAIERYFKKYYVPNNMAICLSGDIDYDMTIRIIDQHFSAWKKDESLKPMVNLPKPIEKSIEREVVGTKEEYVMVGFGYPRSNAKDAILLKVMDAILANQRAGLMDLNLVQKQKVLNAGCWYYNLKDAGVFVLQGNPRQGQRLEEVKEMMLAELNRIKKGDFDESIIKAAIKYLKLKKMQEYEFNDQRAYEYVDIFTRNEDYKNIVDEWNKMHTISKKEIVDYALRSFTNHVTVYKRNGTPKDVLKVEKPPITPIQTNRDLQSDFVKKIIETPEIKFKPTFLDFRKDISEAKLKNGLVVNHVRNMINPTFSLFYILDMGTLNDKKLEFALKYLPFLGTKKYSAQQLQLEFFKLGVSMNVMSESDKMYVSLSGLVESFQEGVALFEEVLKDVQLDQNALQNLKEGIMKERADAKLNKSTIFWEKLRAYAQYGASNPENYVLSNKEVNDLTAEELVGKIKSLMNFKHRVFYYGTDSLAHVLSILKQKHQVSAILKDYPVKKEFKQSLTNESKVLFVDYDMVQAEIGMMSTGIKYTTAIVPQARLFNEYFGGGMGSIVFQEIRESKALAYSAFSAYSLAPEKDKNNMMFAYVGTQADKMKNALDAMKDLLNNLPYSEKSFNLAKDGMIKSIESDRITGLNIFWTYEKALKLGIKEDIRQSVYTFAQNASFQDLKNFYDGHVKNKDYVYAVMGSKKSLDLNLLKSYGPFMELSLQELFGY
jgi:zinc protease